jgi:hypothetical protein
MRRQFRGDQRVRVGLDQDPITILPDAAVRIELPSSVVVSIWTLEKIVDLLGDGSIGSLHITHPEQANLSDLIEVSTTRAWARTDRLVGPSVDREVVLGDLFGELWISGVSYGLFATDASGERLVQNSWLSELEGRDAHIRELSSRRILRMADAIGAIARARTSSEFADGWRLIRGALTRTHDEP